MAIIYLRSSNGTSDADDGSTWALAKTTIAAAVTAAGAGGTVYVSKNHDEVSASTNISLDAGVTSYATPVRVICVDDTGDPEPPTAVSTGATASLAMTGSTFRINFLNSMYVYGMEFRTNNVAANHQISFGADGGAVSSKQVFEKCTINNRATGGAAVIQLGSISNSIWSKTIIWKDCVVTVANTTANTPISNGNCDLYMIGGSLGSAWGNNNVIVPYGNSRRSLFDFNGVDMSVLGSGDYIVNVAVRDQGQISVSNCKIGAGAGLIETFTTNGSSEARVRIDNTSNSDVDIQFLEQNAFGLFQEDTGVYRTGGASDGTTSFSGKVITTVNPEELIFPFRVKLATLWVDVATAKTFTTHIVRDILTTNLQDDEVWLEAEYQDDTTTQTFNEDDRAADILTTPADQTASTEAWTLGGFSTVGTKQQLEVTTTNTGKAGPVTIWLNVAKPSTTLYVCPKIEVT